MLLPSFGPTLRTGFAVMWMEKIRHGVLQISTDTGPRYVSPSFVERVQLLWMFRNFHILPQQVLSRHERQLIEMLCTEERLALGRNGHTHDELCVIGTVERPVKLPPRKPSVSAISVRKQTA
jgi:hypothetical protein